ncbi:efflux RND transporter permease subunit, partial [bacterium]
MNIARWSVTRPVAVTMRIAALVLLGAICLMRLPIDLLPRVDIPIVAVNTSWPNTPPEVMETQVTRPVEQAVSSVPGLYSVSSTSSLGSSFVRVTLDYGVDVDQAATDVLQAVQRASGQFPNDPTLNRPTVFKFDPSTQPILIYGVTGEKDLVKLRTLLKNDITPVIESAGGVAQVNISGGMERAIIVDVDPKKLEAFGIPITAVSNRIQEENTTRPGGIAQRGQREYTIRAEGYLRSVADLAAIPLTARDGRVIRLDQVASVRDAAQEQRVFLKLNGEEAAAFAVTKQAAANTVETARAVEAKIESLKKSYPNLKFTLAYEQAGFIEGSIDELKETAIIGGVLAILVITFFLRNLRSTLVVALSIPISIVSTFAIMYFGGFTLNTISLSGLALATGLIVDDAIVVLENIFRHMEGGKRKAADAAVSGTQEIMSAVVASTFTIMVVFLPLFLIKGQSGQTFTQFALVVIFSIGVSLLDAATVVPMLASRFVKEKEVEEVHHPEKIKSKISFFRWAGFRLNEMDHGYRRLLEGALKRRWLVLGGAVAATVITFPLVDLVGFETLPQTDSGDAQINMRL